MLYIHAYSLYAHLVTLFPWALPLLAVEVVWREVTSGRRAGVLCVELGNLVLVEREVVDLEIALDS